MTRTILFALFCSAIPLLARADDKENLTERRPQRPIVEFGAWAVGTWKCTDEWSDLPGIPAHEGKATLTIQWGHGNFFVVSHFKEEKSASNPYPFEFTEYWGVNGAPPVLTRTSFDSFGGWGVSTTTGWVENKLTLHGGRDVGDDKEWPRRESKLQETMVLTRNGQKSFTFSLSWVTQLRPPYTGLTGTCTR